MPNSDYLLDDLSCCIIYIIDCAFTINGYNLKRCRIFIDSVNDQINLSNCK